jgi:hypothetical protein
VMKAGHWGVTEYVFSKKKSACHSMCYGIRSPQNDFQSYRPVTPILQALLGKWPNFQYHVGNDQI